jgi:hypothetical protein
VRGVSLPGREPGPWYRGVIDWNRGGRRCVCLGVTRYVPADLEEVGAELSRRAAEAVEWLDSVADGGGRPVPLAPDEDAALARAVARVDLVCFQALSAAVARLVSAAESVAACASDMHGVDVELAERICRWSG